MSLMTRFGKISGRYLLGEILAEAIHLKGRDSISINAVRTGHVGQTLPTPHL